MLGSGKAPPFEPDRRYADLIALRPPTKSGKNSGRYSSFNLNSRAARSSSLISSFVTVYSDESDDEQQRQQSQDASTADKLAQQAAVASKVPPPQQFADDKSAKKFWMADRYAKVGNCPRGATRACA